MSAEALLEVFYEIASGGYVASTSISHPSGVPVLGPAQMSELMARPDFRRVSADIRVTLDQKPR